MQFRPPSGQSFWDLSHVRWSDLECGHPPHYKKHRFVQWQGREWLCKCDENALDEVAGYQIAETLGLPVQPWVAFFQRQEPGQDGFAFANGILVERMQAPRSYGRDLLAPIVTHRSLVGKLLALEAMDRCESPVWLSSGDQADWRLVDLQYYGPKLVWPIKEELVAMYGEDASCWYNHAQHFASEEGMVPEFEAGICILLALDFTRVFNFSGHPYATVLEEAVIRGVSRWQTVILRLRGASAAA